MRAGLDASARHDLDAEMTVDLTEMTVNPTGMIVGPTNPTSVCG